MRYYWYNYISCYTSSGKIETYFAYFTCRASIHIYIYAGIHIMNIHTYIYIYTHIKLYVILGCVCQQLRLRWFLFYLSSQRCRITHIYGEASAFGPFTEFHRKWSLSSEEPLPKTRGSKMQQSEHNSTVQGSWDSLRRSCVTECWWQCAMNFVSIALAQGYSNSSLTPRVNFFQ